MPFSTRRVLLYPNITPRTYRTAHLFACEAAGPVDKVRSHIEGSRRRAEHSHGPLDEPQVCISALSGP